MRRVLGWGVVVLAAGAALVAVLLGRPAVQDAVLARVIPHLVGRTADALLGDDALRVALCGSSAPLPHPTRAKSCVAVFAAGRFWTVDTGPNSWNNLALWRVDARRIGAVLYTHFHSDHIAELGEFNLQTWVAGRPRPLLVIGPPGVERLVRGFEEAYALDTQYRIAHHGADFNVPELARMEARAVDAPPGAGLVTVLDEDGLRISAFSVDHRPVVPAYGYRFDYRGRSVVVSGDTAKSADLVAAAAGADVLVHEAQSNHLIGMIGDAAGALGRERAVKIMRDIPDYHTTPVEAAVSANQAGVKLLVFAHLNPPPPNRFIERIFVRGVADVRPDGWVLGDDGTLVTLPAGSDAVQVGTVAAR